MPRICSIDPDNKNITCCQHAYALTELWYARLSELPLTQFWITAGLPASVTFDEFSPLRRRVPIGDNTTATPNSDCGVCCHYGMSMNPRIHSIAAPA